MNCNKFTINELNSFYSTVACAHPPCTSSSLDAIVAPIQDIDDSALSFYEITTAEVYETARMFSRKSKEQSLDGLLWKHLESLLLPLLPFSLKIFNCSISSNTYSDLWKRNLWLKVERLMNAGIRFIYNLRRDTHISPYRLELEWLRACDRRKYFQGCFTFRILNTQRPLYFYQAL